MLKGVHHQIIEIRQTEDPFFERALLFVRPQCAESGEEDWQEKGRAFLKRAVPYTGLKKARVHRRLQAALYVIGGGIGGVILGVVASHMG